MKSGDPEQKDDLDVEFSEPDYELPDITDESSDFIDDSPDEAESTIDNDYEEKNSDNDRPNTGEQYRGINSRAGEMFDPSKHAVPPVETKTGKWRKKRRKNNDEEIIENESYVREAQKLATIYAESHKIVYGEGAAVSQSELSPLVDSIQGYMMENGLADVPPWVAVLLTGAAYTSNVASRKVNEEKTHKLKELILEKFKSIMVFLRLKRDE